MGKASRRKREQAEGASSIHEQIAHEAAHSKALPLGMGFEGRYPALSELFRAVRGEVYRSTPRQVTFQGRTYWCRVSHGMSLVEVFDSPASGTPLARTICGSTDLHGHSRNH